MGKRNIGRLLTGLGGLLMLLSLAMAWFELGGPAVEQARQFVPALEITQTIYDRGALAGILLALAGLAALLVGAGLFALDAAGFEMESPFELAWVALGAGIAGLLVAIYGLTAKPGIVDFVGQAIPGLQLEVSLATGAILALIGSLAAIAGSVLMLMQREPVAAAPSQAPMHVQ